MLNTAATARAVTGWQMHSWGSYQVRHGCCLNVMTVLHAWFGNADHTGLCGDVCAVCSILGQQELPLRGHDVVGTCHSDAERCAVNV